MEVRCDQCQARYRVDDARVGPKGLSMRCGKCGNTFRLQRDGTVTKALARPPGIPTPGTATPLATSPAPLPRTAAPGSESPGGTAVFQPAPQVKSEPAVKAVPTLAPAAATTPVPAAPAAPAISRPTGSDVPRVPATRETPPLAEPPARTPAPVPASSAQVPPGAVAKAHRRARSMQMDDAPSGPSRSLVLGVAIAVVGLAIVLGGFGYWNKHRPPPAAAVEALGRAKASAEKDSLPALAEAESQATAAIEAAPRGYAAAYAALAEIEVAWADALDDEADFDTDRAERAARAGDDQTKIEAEGRASAFLDQAKGRMRQASEAALAGRRIERSPSPEVALALADYYRAAASRTNVTLELKRAASLGADPARIAFVQGADLLGQEDAVPQAVDRLEEAVRGAPTNARYRFRLSLAYLKALRTEDAQKSLQETLRLSPVHERAKLALQALAGRAETRDGKTR